MDMEFRALLLAGVLLPGGCGIAPTDAQAIDGSRAADRAARSPAGATSVRDALASPGGLEIDAGGIALRLISGSCETIVAGLLSCTGDIRLDIVPTGAAPRQTLHPRTLMVKSDALAFRGALPVDARPEAHSIVISDVNGDQHEDVLLWSGRDGAYGGASFDVYLFEPDERTFRFSQALSDLTLGYSGLFGVDGDHITANATSGCCVHIQETYVVNANVPVLVERITTDESADDTSRTIIERLTDGELRVVDAE